MAGYSYAQIARMLRDLIDTGEVPPGGQLPSEPALADQFGVTRTTVREAFNRLIQQGLIYKHPYKGHFVRPVQPIVWKMTQRDRVDLDGDTAQVDPWLAAVENAGYTGRQDIKVRIVGPDERLADRTLGDLMTGPGGQPLQHAVVRDRVRYMDGQINELARSYYPMDVAEGTAIIGEADIQPSIYHLLGEMGHVQTGGLDTAWSRMPTEDEHKALDLQGVQSILEVVRSVRFTPDDRVLLVRHSLYVGGTDKEFQWEI